MGAIQNGDVQQNKVDRNDKQPAVVEMPDVGNSGARPTQHRRKNTKYLLAVLEHRENHQPTAPQNRIKRPNPLCVKIRLTKMMDRNQKE